MKKLSILNRYRHSQPQALIPCNSLTCCNRRTFLSKIKCLALFWPFVGFFSCKPAAKKPLGPLTLTSLDQINEGANFFELERLIVYKHKVADSGQPKYRLSAMSLVCTHQECMLNQSSSGFTCPCHGSQFDRSGKLLTGPAKTDLNWFKLSLDQKRQLVVERSEIVDRQWGLEVTI